MTTQLSSRLVGRNPDIRRMRTSIPFGDFHEALAKVAPLFDVQHNFMAQKIHISGVNGICNASAEGFSHQSELHVTPRVGRSRKCAAVVDSTKGSSIGNVVKHGSIVHCFGPELQFCTMWSQTRLVSSSTNPPASAFGHHFPLNAIMTTGANVKWESRNSVVPLFS